MIAIVGNGNVASHLYRALENKCPVTLINPRTFENLPDNADLILLCVSDNAIREVSLRLSEFKGIIAHTAGSVPMDIFKGKFENYGVFYPLQTFTKEVALDYEKIPVFIEGSSKEVKQKLASVAGLFTKTIKEIDSERRKKLHLASIFACNFTNALAGIAAEIMEEAGMEFDTLLPLMKQTVDKLEDLTPAEAQTGPAVRGDSKVLSDHLDMLVKKPRIRHLYNTLSSYIYEKNLKR